MKLFSYQFLLLTYLLACVKCASVVYPSNCHEIPISRNGTYIIDPSGDNPIPVECRTDQYDHLVWTVVLNRVSNVGGFFDRPYDEYENGFGTPEGNFWFGLENIHNMIKQQPVKMRIEATNDRGFEFSIEYDLFNVHSKEKRYELRVGNRVSGNLYDSFSDMNGARFEAYDNAVSNCSMCQTSSIKCANAYEAGWWYINGMCYMTCLTCNPSTSHYGSSWFDDYTGSWMRFSRVRMMIKPVVPWRPANCYEIHKKKPELPDGIYGIYLFDDEPSKVTRVFCEMSKGGWTIIFNKVTPNATFDKLWNDYRDGFGEIDGDHWLGLIPMSLLTQRTKMELRMEMTNSVEDQNVYEYENFLVGSEADKFRLRVSQLSLTSFPTTTDLFAYHNNMFFTTRDKKNCNYTTNCSVYLGGGGWWFNACHYICLTCNSRVLDHSAIKKDKMNYTKMMIRPNIKNNI